jgi:hypothetical protein
VATEEEEVVAAKARWKEKETVKLTALVKVKEEAKELVRVNLAVSENLKVTAKAVRTEEEWDSEEAIPQNRHLGSPRSAPAERYFEIQGFGGGPDQTRATATLPVGSMDEKHAAAAPRLVPAGE